MDVRNLADLYELPPVDWAAIEARLDRGLTLAPDGDRQACWLTTINPDASPHVNGIGAVWVEGTFWFVTGERSRKGRNLARDPRCVMSVSTDEFDLVVEGTVEQITDPTTVAKLAAIWAAGGWPARPDETGEALTAEYSAPSAGPPPWHVYRLTARSATAVSTIGPGGATRWHF